jgi:transcriptional regulator with XRE-family HTH domain
MPELVNFLPERLLDSAQILAEPGAARTVRHDPIAIAILESASTFNTGATALHRWGLYFPQNTALFTLVEPEVVRRPARLVAPIPTGERIRDILRYLGLTKTQLKDICGVSRQTLYDWLEGKFEPDTDNAARLQEIHSAALVVPQRARRPLSAAVLTRPVLGKETLLDLLRRPRLDLGVLNEAIALLAERSGEREQRSAKALRERLGFSAAKREDEVLADNADDLGSE